MKSLLAIIFIMIFLGNEKVYSQISFLGFDKAPCGIIENKKISYMNYEAMCDSHSSGYRIFSDGVKIFEKCESFSSYRILDLKFITENIGFLVERSGFGNSIYKTIDAGKSWNAIGGGAPTYLGFYIVNQNTGYLITTWNSPLNIYISRVSDIKRRSISDSRIMNDTLINDTIWGTGLCDIKSLSFKVKNSQDTINYQISFNDIPSNINNTYVSEKSFFPNPAHNYIQFSKDFNITNECEITIFDSYGRLIRSLDINQDKYYIGDLKKGLYLIEFVEKDKRTISKLIKN